ncbi:ABC transporter substrate-binding protein [Natrinema versiforme]|uniref:ABC-type nitrate/sulfonate/bicarbonate transport systems periplasmic components-like protein n=1 Tax=Natrinema versiforme JCM 10478 TaxID=1227496 RepID=L9Y1E9_9EURY|nr:ABC transporter substrate-binding protein [Natrinema versiforme]ELY67924.1 ABC-type nitrate/sulfonate/bicarbonate transport systems periplasmic components-like protein [Natrinema versiforme JCM 10478]
MLADQSIRLFHLPFSFMLPQTVAAERGYYREEGLAVELVERERRDVSVKYIPAEETLTGDYDVDLYPICKWESIRRTWDMDDGRVVANGTFANLPYTVFTRPESAIESPADLANVPVGVNLRTGQEYTARKALEEHVSPDEITLVGCGMPTDRLRALYEGRVDAVTLIDPHSTLADHLGFRRLLEYDNHMGIVGSEDIDRDLLEAFLRAYGRSVADINATPDAFRGTYLEMLEADAAVAPDLFEDVDIAAVREEITVPRYEVPDPVDREELDDHLEWMRERGLIDENAAIDDIAAPL